MTKTVGSEMHLTLQGTIPLVVAASTMITMEAMECMYISSCQCKEGVGHRQLIERELINWRTVMKQAGLYIHR